MSQGLRVSLGYAQSVAALLVELLKPGCVRLEVAGSIRREKPEVGDIELVAVPRSESMATGLWGEVVERDALQDRITALSVDGTLSLRDVEIHRKDGTVETGHRDGAAYKALVFRDIPVDLFIVRPPAEWGVILAIRTGPGDWNEKIVTDCQRYFRRVQGGQVLHFGKPVPCPEETDFFRAVGQPWVAPSARSVDRVAITAAPRREALASQGQP